jgi:hypothetical protein
MKRLVQKIVSGGQTGADRAALDWAIEHGVPHSGWCPKGRLAEDGVIHLKYQLQETPSSSYGQRTEWNIRDSNGTVIFSIARVLTRGSKKTMEFAHEHGKPLIHISKAGGLLAPATAFLEFIEANEIRVLNVAGPRASEEAQVGRFVKEVLDKAWASE